MALVLQAELVGEKKMSVTRILFLAAAILFFIAAIGWTVLPNPMIWAMFCVALGLFLHGFDLNLKVHR
jgi:hypothetical protein